MVRISTVFLACVFICLSDAFRLPGHVVPTHYSLQIVTRLEKEFKFTGNVEIETTCIHPTSNITLHSQNLTISENEITVTDTSNRNLNIKVNNIEYDEEKNFLVINLTQPLLEEHNYLLNISFEGKLTDDLLGFYRSSYVDQKTKKKKWLAVTQFEPTYARKAFPCFDEPAMKSTFEIMLGRQEEYASISNMPLVSTEPIAGMAGWFWDKFENSVPMSTYLVAFMVSDFGYTTAEPINSESNVTFRIWARKDALKQVGLAETVGPKALNFFEQYFDIKFPLPKQDMVAIPDFSSGAMENWGLITYREVALLFDPEQSSTTSQHYVASVVSHELAHQWFGNLVTMNWWTDLWLNEGFATYMAGLAVGHLFPQWNSLQEEVCETALTVFSFDGLKSSHPVSVPVKNPAEIWEIFDTISYKKGSFLIRMMSLFLGENVHRQGVSNYLKKHKYGNAEQDDLWNSLTESAHKNKVLPEDLTVKIIMDTWTLQTGYPVITVTRDYAAGKAEVTQERFLRDSIKWKNTNPSCWWVPLSYTSQLENDFNHTTPKAWLSCPQKPHTVTGLPNATEWIIFNIQIAGLYKVNYDDQNWQLLINTLKSDKYEDIPLLNRVQLVDDAFDFAWVGILKYDVLFNLIGYLNYETEYVAWKTCLNNLQILDRQVRRTPLQDKFDSFMKQLLTPVYQKIGGLVVRSTLENLRSIKYQVMITGKACRYNAVDCVKEVNERFVKHQQNPNDTNIIPNDLRGVIYCTAIKTGGEKEWDLIWHEYLKSNLAGEKNTLLRTLGCAKDTKLLRRYLEWSLDENSGIRKQDCPSVFASVASNINGFEVAKEFLYGNIQKIRDYLDSSRRLTRFISPLAAQIKTEPEYEEFQNFIAKNKEMFVDIKKGVEQALETAKLNVQWTRTHIEHVSNILEKLSK